jgi:hypothetical protein
LPGLASRECHTGEVSLLWRPEFAFNPAQRFVRFHRVLCERLVIQFALGTLKCTQIGTSKAELDTE